MKNFNFILTLSLTLYANKTTESIKNLSKIKPTCIFLIFMLEVDKKDLKKNIYSEYAESTKHKKIIKIYKLNFTVFSQYVLYTTACNSV